MKRYAIIPLLLLTLLSSCGIYSSYKPVETVREDLFGSVEASDTSSMGNIAWNDFFTDRKLQHLIEKGLQQNTDLLTAQWRVKEAEASLTAAKLSFLPGLSLAPQGTVSNMANNETYTLPVAASWQVDLFGSLLNAKRATNASLLQSMAMEQAVKVQVVSGIANSYYTLLMVDEQLSIALSTREMWKESVEVARALKKAGQYTEAGVAQTEATYYDVCKTVEELKNEIVIVQNSLCLLLAETPREIERGTLSEQQFTHSIAIGVPLMLLRNRPDVMGSEAELRRVFYGVQQARSAFYPSLNLSGNLGWTNNAGLGITNPAVYIQNATASLVQPIFNRGQNVSRLKIAKAQQEEAKLGFEQTLLNAGVEVNNALTNLQLTNQKAELFRQQIVALERAVKSTHLLMKNSSTNYLEVLTAEKTLLSARLAQTANQFSEIQSRINLYQALGGGKF